jgi:hypothetical protein
VVTFGIVGTVGLNYAVASDEVAAFRQGSGAAPPPRTSCDQAQLSLSEHSLQPSGAEPGSALTLRYTIANQGDAPASVVLGASLRPTGGGNWVNDPADDTEVTVEVPQGTASRVFQIPAGIASGRYDVAWGLFCSGSHASQALVIETAALTIDSMRTNSSGPAAASDPAATVRQFYAFIDAGDLDHAWSLLSAHFKGTSNEQAWKNGYRTTRGSKVTTATTTSQSASSATVAFALVATDASTTGTVTKQFAGTWTLVKSGRDWLLDRASVKQVN